MPTMDEVLAENRALKAKDKATVAENQKLKKKDKENVAKIRKLEAQVGRLSRTSQHAQVIAELETELARVRPLLALLSAPPDAKLFRDPKFAHAWGVMNMFIQMKTAKLLRLGGRVQTDIHELTGLAVPWLTNPAMWSRKEDGFNVMAQFFLSSGAPEPGRSLRRPVMAKLRAMQAGSVKEFCEFISEISEICFGVLPGPAYSPGGDSGDFETGFGVPACYAGKSGKILVPAGEWTPHVAAVLKEAAGLVAEARKPGGQQIPGVPDLTDAPVVNAGNGHGRGTADYTDYQYAAAICQSASFGATMESVYAGEAAIVLVADIKGTDRYDAKLNEYAAAGKPSPKGQHIKDVLRCLIKVAGHAEMKRAHTVLEQKCTVRSTKVRIDKATHDLLCVIELEHGVIAEVQIGFTSVVAMKQLGHEGYKYARVDTSDLERAHGLKPLFKCSILEPPSITDFSSGTAVYTAGFDKVPTEEFAFISLD